MICSQNFQISFTSSQSVANIEAWIDLKNVVVTYKSSKTFMTIDYEFWFSIFKFSDLGKHYGQE